MKLGFCSALCLIFITLKLCNILAWSWLWILSPLWIPLAFAILVLLIVWIINLLESPRHRINPYT